MARFHSCSVVMELRIAKPCPEDWNVMDGDERIRACARCQRNVYNLSDLTEIAATELIRQHEGKHLCVRYFARPDGTVMTRDCKVGVANYRTRLLKVAAVTLGAGLTVFCIVYCAVLPRKRPLTAERLINKGRSTAVIGPIINKISPAPPIVLMGHISFRSVPPIPSPTSHP